MRSPGTQSSTATAVIEGDQHEATARRFVRARDAVKGFVVSVLLVERSDAGCWCRTRRWPDLVVQRPTGRLAVELEFAPKWAQRLKSIMAGYAHSDYREVRWIVTLPTLAARVLMSGEALRAAASVP